MLELRDHEDLALEALDVDAGDELRRQHLDDDSAAERRVVRDEDARHPAAGELALEDVRASECCLESTANVHALSEAVGCRPEAIGRAALY